MSKVVLVGSGFSSKQIEDYDYKGKGWIIVAINHGWMACPDTWDYWVKASDYRSKQPENVRKDQEIIKKYRPALDQFGGQRACGYSITLNAGYWVLANLYPTVMGFLGADMNYTPNEKGHTHIYGVGLDIKKNNGVPDPDRMVQRYGKTDPNYLQNIYMRLVTKAHENGCKVVNLSKDIDTRLPYKRMEPQNL